MKRAWISAILGLAAVSGSGAQEPPGDDRDALREASRRLSRRLRREFEDPARAPWNLAALAQSLDQDPEKIRSYVAALRYEPYPGLQRGPVGVLASGAGNAGDKALLLAELLRRSGREVRLMRGTLPPKQAAELVAALVPAPAEPPADPALLQDACAEAGLDASVAVDLLRTDAALRRRRTDEAARLAARETAFLRGRDAGAPAPPPRAVAKELAAWARAHYWVEWKGPGADDWTPMDPCFPAPPGLKGAEVDPAAAADRVSITLRMARVADAKSENVVLFAHEVPVHHTLLHPLRFSIRPSGTYAPPAKPEDRAKALKALARFQAELRVGAERLGSKVFDLDGSVRDVAPDGGLLDAKEKLAGVVDLFQGLDGEPKKKKKTELKSLAVVLEAKREGKTLWKQDRVVLAEGERDAWCPLLDWNLFLQSQPFSGAFARGMHARHAVRNEALAERVDDWVAAGGPPAQAEALSETPAFYYPLALLDFCRERQAFVRSLAPRLGMLWEAPDLFIAGRQLRFKDGGSSICACSGMDLVENGALVLDGADGWALRRDLTTALGVFDTSLEQVRVGWANESEASFGTIAAFERERCLGKSDFALAGANDRAALEKTGLPKADVEWIRRNQRPGRQVLVAGGPAAHCEGGAAWWEIEPATGRTLGRISGGRGGCLLAQEGTDYVTVFTFVASSGFCFWDLVDNMHDRHPAFLSGAQFVVCMGGAATGAAGGARAARIGLALVIASGFIDRLQFLYGDP